VTGASERDGEVTVERDLAVAMPGRARRRAGLWRPIDPPSQRTGPLRRREWRP
jgi:hypothetical protein